MNWRYNYATDRFAGHDHRAVFTNRVVGWELDELELGARVALGLDDPEQTWWELERLQRREVPDLLDKWRSQVDVHLHQ